MPNPKGYNYDASKLMSDGSYNGGEITPAVFTASKPKKKTLSFTMPQTQLSSFDIPDMGDGWTAADQAGVDSLFQQDLQNAQASVNGGDGGSGGGSGASSILASLGVGKMAGGMLSGIGESIGGKKYGTFSDDEKASQDAIRGALEMIPGYGTAIAAATGLVDAIGSATGLNLSSVNKDTAERAGVKGTEFNKIMNMLPGNSMIWGGLSRMFGNGRTKQLDITDEVLSMSDGYSGTVRDLEAAKDLGNKQLFFGQTDQANDFINSQKRSLDLMKATQKVNTQRKQSDYYQDLQNQNINRFSGQNYLNTHVGKNGMKLMSIEEARQIIALRKVADTEDVTKLQNGGNIPGIDTNILPEGSLHKELNHLAEVNPDLEDVTKKGIPVVENTDNQQVAEIEDDELIFRLEVTEKLEALMKDGSEEAMIEAGKLLASEIIENTQDNTGQITEE